MLHTRRIRSKARSARQLRTSEHAAESLPLSVISYSQAEETIAGTEGLVRDDGGVPVAETTGPLPGHQIVTRDICQPGHLRIQQRNIDRLALPGANAGKQGGLNSIGSEQTSSDVNDGHAYFHGLAVRLPGDTHHPAPPLNDEIVAG